MIMTFWSTHAWHHSVHELLGETLHYYLVRVRPFDARDVSKRLGQLVQQQKIGSIRVFKLFGPYDLLVRTWLHPTVAAHFHESLAGAFETSARLPYFAVENIHYRWYWEIDRKL